MTEEKKFKIIEELVSTRINGNSIKGNKTYENMLRRISIQDIIDFAKTYFYKWGLSKVNRKIDLIESIVDHIKNS